MRLHDPLLFHVDASPSWRVVLPFEAVAGGLGLKQDVSGNYSMNIKEVGLYLRSLGWLVRNDEVGDKVAQLFLPDRIVNIIYGLDRISDQQKLGATLTVSTDVFSNACSKISGKQPKFYPLVCAWKGPDIRASEILEEHVRKASEEAIAWAKEQDLDKAMRDYAALPTDAPGARPIWHLAALALLGDVTKLKSYQASFEAGDRLGFVNYVTKDFIDRAVAFAEGATELI